MLSVKELFFTLGVVNSFTLSVVGLSVAVPVSYTHLTLPTIYSV